MTAIKIIAGVGYFALGLLQFFATFAGLEVWVGLHWILAGPIALFLAYVPIIGSIVGIFGAIYGWGWSAFSAIALFAGPPVVFLVGAALAGGLAALFTKRRAT